MIYICLEDIQVKRLHGKHSTFHVLKLPTEISQSTILAVQNELELVSS